MMNSECPLVKFRVFLVRADEFDKLHQPIVSYYLRMHVGQQLMKDPNEESRSFLLKLISRLEKDKSNLGPLLTAEDPRTVVTRSAIQLFTRADDLEREGNVSQQIIQLFFAASLLFEASAQFTEGTMDSFATEKHKYARFIAALMKKSLSTNTPYQSPNGEIGEKHSSVAKTNGFEETNDKEVPNYSHQNQLSNQPLYPPPQQPPPQQPSPQQPPPQQPPSQQPPSQQPPPQQPSPQQPPPQQPSPPSSVTEHPTPSEQWKPQPVSSHYYHSSVKPSIQNANQIMAAQKLAQAGVSALQFNDSGTAKLKLRAALNILEK